MAPQKPMVEVYGIPAPIMQEIITILTSLPWGQVNATVVKLLAVVTAQEKAAHEAAQE